jgi:oxygen-dependent protoporphyrinogen oxidase
MQIYDVLIIGGGLSGLSVAHFLSMLKPELKVAIVEKEARPGGCIQTFNAEGIQAEWGPHGFLNNTPESLELLNNLGLDKNMQQAPLGNFLRYLCHNKKLVALPQSPQKLLATPLLSFPGKLRLLADLWKAPKAKDQTIADWAAYRFGKGVLPMIDAAVTGTFAGDMNKLSIDSIMPGVRDLEKENGSVLRGLIKNKNQKNASAKGLPSMLNFPHGMEQFPAAMAKGKEILFGNTVEKLEKNGDHWNIIAGAQKIQARSVVIALPLNNALNLLAPFDKPPVLEIPTAKIINVVMAFSETASIPYGFGYLAPAKENRFALGAMFSSHMFPDRVPAGNGLLEVLIGGRRHPEQLELDDKDLIQKAFEDVSQLMDLPEKPWFSKVLRASSGIPQLEMDHPALLVWRDAFENNYSKLYICGFGWDGVGMNEMVKSAKKTALKLVEGSEKVKEKSQGVKPVYF